MMAPLRGFGKLLLRAVEQSTPFRVVSPSCCACVNLVYSRACRFNFLKVTCLIIGIWRACNVSLRRSAFACLERSLGSYLLDSAASRQLAAHYEQQGRYRRQQV